MIPHFPLGISLDSRQFPPLNLPYKTMNDRDPRRYARLTRIQNFGADHAADFANSAKAQRHFTAIEGYIAGLDQARAGQLPARVSKETLLDALVLDFKNIARTARSIALKENGFAVPYIIPSNPAEIAITTHADSLLKRLKDNNDPVEQGGDTPAQKAAKAALRARFIEYLLPDDFVEDLAADREAIREANAHNQSENQSGIEDTARIGQILALAADDVQELDAMMQNKYARDSVKLHTWQTASRVERAPQREDKADAPGGAA